MTDTMYRILRDGVDAKLSKMLLEYLDHKSSAEEPAGAYLFLGEDAAIAAEASMREEILALHNEMQRIAEENGHHYSSSAYASSRAWLYKYASIRNGEIMCDKELPEEYLIGDSESRLCKLREAAGLTQQKLADTSGINRVKIARIETGSVKIENVTLANATAMAKALGCHAEDLL